MSLSETKIKNAKPGQKNYKLFDERGMYLLVTPNGGLRWRFKFRFNGKEQCLSLGVYPDVSLKRAREKRDEARRLLADGVDPSEHRKATKLAKAESNAQTFEVIAREWIEHKSKNKKQSGGFVERYAKDLLRRIEYDLFGPLGAKPITEITAPEILRVLRRVEERGAYETAHRLLQNCGQIFRYAISTSRAKYDPSRDLKDALVPVQRQHRAAITNPNGVAHLLRAIDGYHGSPIVRAALKLAPLFFVRPGELRKAEWKEINFDTAEWNIPAERMKMKQPHLVPLCRQAIEILKDLHTVTSSGEYLFPNPRNRFKPLSDNAVLAALRGMGFAKDEMSGHGFRAMARTIMDEVLGIRPDFIEHQLAHTVRDPLGRAYNRTSHLLERKKMMQDWANYLDDLRNNVGGEVIPMKRETI